MYHFSLNIIIYTLLCFFISSSFSLAQVKTLKSLQKYAFESRNIIKKYKTDLELANEKIKETKAEFLPSIDLQYAMNRLNHDSATGEGKENDFFQAKVSWNAFAGYKDFYNLKSAETMTDYSKSVLESISQDIYLNIALKYLDIYTNLEKLKVAEDEVKLYNDRLREIELKFKVGVLKKSDVLKIKVERDNALQAETRARANVQMSLNLLALATGQVLTKDELDFSIFDSTPTQGTYEEYELLFLKQRSDLNALKSSFESSEMKIHASKSEFYPEVDLSLSYNSHTRDDFFMESLEASDDEVRFQAVVSMNMYDGMKKYSKLSQASLAKNKIQYDIKELENSLKTTLKNTMLDIDVAFDNLEVAATGTKEAQENLRVTDLGFEQGLGTSSDVLDAIYNLSRARFNQLSAYSEVFLNDFKLKRLLENF